MTPELAALAYLATFPLAALNRLLRWLGLGGLL